MVGNAKLKRELLRGPLAKIERAKEHVHELNGQVAEYLGGNPFQLRIRERSNPHDRLVYIEAKKAVPEHFALILGGAVIPALKEMVVSTEDAVRRLAAAFFK